MERVLADRHPAVLFSSVLDETSIADRCTVVVASGADAGTCIRGMDDDAIAGIDCDVVDVITGCVEYEITRLQLLETDGLCIRVLITGAAPCRDPEVLKHLLYETGTVGTIRERSAAINVRISEELLRVLDQCLTGSRRCDDRKTAADRLYDGGTGLDDVTAT